jgi:hypothetical protein
VHSHADKKTQNKSTTAENVTRNPQEGNAAGYPFIDNRPVAIAQRKLQEIANNSPRLK